MIDQKKFLLVAFVVGWLCCASFLQARINACNLRPALIPTVLAISLWPITVPLLAAVVNFSEDRCNGVVSGEKQP